MKVINENNHWFQEKGGEIWAGFNLWFLGREDNGFWGGTRSGNGAAGAVVEGEVAEVVVVIIGQEQ